MQPKCCLGGSSYTHSEMALEWTRVTTVREGGLISVVLPSLQAGTTVEVVIRGDLAPQTRGRKFGSAKGQGRMRDDFEDPIEDFRDYI